MSGSRQLRRQIEYQPSISAHRVSMPTEHRRALLTRFATLRGSLFMGGSVYSARSAFMSLGIERSTRVSRVCSFVPAVVTPAARRSSIARWISRWVTMTGRHSRIADVDRWRRRNGSRLKNSRRWPADFRIDMNVTCKSIRSVRDGRAPSAEQGMLHLPEGVFDDGCDWRTDRDHSRRQRRVPNLASRQGGESQPHAENDLEGDRAYATAAANPWNRSPGSGCSRRHVTAIGRSPT